MTYSESPRDRVLTALTDAPQLSENALLALTGLTLVKLTEALEDLLHEERIISTDKLLNDDVYYTLSSAAPAETNIVQFPTASQ